PIGIFLSLDDPEMNLTVLSWIDHAKSAKVGVSPKSMKFRWFLPSTKCIKTVQYDRILFSSFRKNAKMQICNPWWWISMYF
ncbi:MAG: hypothetical protein MJA29_10720, partial [Candidatus Omnitrophica bacterium]|nr:hypothetical protein [Candidatus Omnitrophota bacterium]